MLVYVYMYVCVYTCSYFGFVYAYWKPWIHVDTSYSNPTLYHHSSFACFMFTIPFSKSEKPDSYYPQYVCLFIQPLVS